ncbi:hypothetical protein DM01DRAFT_1411765 [Hesseltinella vesiculosa]|uniref:Uncharacterized protein n=1 Tax=Hesseltinella vesiculosa TaxID=101127 RepID=A0A1X2G2N0_9FUNG|nr:hypothetical protein DM01DRAFT_1411765 [Hesseltinella vesiculosa]
MDDHWCTNCDKAISAYSNSLYCSEECLRADALSHHPLLGYDYAELKDFPRSSSSNLSTSPVSSRSPSFSTASLPSPQASPMAQPMWHKQLSPPSSFVLDLPKLDTPPASPVSKKSAMFFI